MNILRLVLLSFGILILPYAVTAQTESNLGEFRGAMETTHPDWFKQSFLEFEEDIDEAASAGKRLVIYFHQDGCPYCNKLVEENFTDPEILEKMHAGFDLVAINMWGDREVVQVGGKAFTEKTLASALDVDFTPTLLFFSEDRQVALRLNGYYPIADFSLALDYVAEKKEKEMSFTDYLALRQDGKSEGDLNTAEWLLTGPYNLAEMTGGKPIAVLFEEPDCDNCDLLHSRTFTHPDAPALIDSFQFVQLNRWSDTEVIKPDGTTTSAAEWAKELELGYSPAIVLFDSSGNQVFVIGAMLRTFHILSILDYISSGTYQTEPNLQRYISERAEHIRSQGKDVDIWEY